MSELLPIHALKAQIIQHALDLLESAPHNFTDATADDVDELWDVMRVNYPDTMQDALDPAKRCDPPVLYEGHWVSDDLSN